jgi:hypothetical protein
MNNNTFNMRNPSPGEVSDMQMRAKRKREQIIKYKLLSQLLDGKTVDLTQSAALFEALNRERMEFDEILKLHPDQAKDCLDQAKEDREAGRGKSAANWAIKGHIPPCLFYARPKEYWKNPKILKEFFRIYPKFQVTK